MSPEGGPSGGGPVRRTWRRCFCFGLCAVVLMLVSACAPADDGGAALNGTTQGGTQVTPAQAHIVVTLDFGTRTLLDAVAAIDADTTALDALKAVAEVGTAYGGGFVQSINGTGSSSVSGTSSKADWFYYVNGFTARTGAAGYRVHDGDTVNWDYHPWGTRQGISATIGCFPQAFVNGYGGERRSTVVACEEPFAGEAAAIVSLLKARGAPDVVSLPLVEVTQQQRESLNLVIVAGSAAPEVLEIYENRTKLGLFTSLHDSVLRTYSASGSEAGAYTTGTGVLEAMQSPWNPSGTGACENVVLLVSGCDEDGVRRAAQAVVESHAEFLTWCAALVTSDGAAGPVPDSLA